MIPDRLFLPLLAIAGSLMLIAAFWPPPAQAQESSCQFELVPTVLQLSAQSIPHKVLDPAERNRFVSSLEHQIGFNFPEVRNVLLAELSGVLVYGLEINGCLTAPQALAAPKPVKRSGATPAVVFA